MPETVITARFGRSHARRYRRRRASESRALVVSRRSASCRVPGGHVQRGGSIASSIPFRLQILGSPFFSSCSFIGHLGFESTRSNYRAAVLLRRGPPSGQATVSRNALSTNASTSWRLCSGRGVDRRGGQWSLRFRRGRRIRMCPRTNFESCCLPCARESGGNFSYIRTIRMLDECLRVAPGPRRCRQRRWLSSSRSNCNQGAFIGARARSAPADVFSFPIVLLSDGTGRALPGAGYTCSRRVLPGQHVAG